MAKDYPTPEVHTSPTHDTFQLMFDTYDVFSSYWQPMIKAARRWQIEMANLSARQGQATLDYSQRLLRSASPADAVNETLSYWQKLFDNASESAQQLAVSAVKAAQAPAGFHFMGNAPAKPARDIIVFDEHEGRRIW